MIGQLLGGKFDFAKAAKLLQMEIARQNQTKNRSTGLIPITVWQQALLQKTGSLRACPHLTLLDLHLSFARFTDFA